MNKPTHTYTSNLPRIISRTSLVVFSVVCILGACAHLLSSQSNDTPPSTPVAQYDNFDTTGDWKAPTSVKNMNDTETDAFVIGRSFFTIPWVTAPSSTSSRDGLGPLFNANTCESCHLKKLNTRTDFSQPHKPPRSLVIKLSQPNTRAHRKHITTLDPVYGGQIAINGVKGVPYEGKVNINIQTKNITLSDGEVVTLKHPQPYLTQLNYGPLAPKTRISMRQAPALLDLGLIERIPKQAIIAQADPTDANHDGISGRANRVFDPVTQKIALGLFGHKASQASLLSQTADAASNDMGLTNTIHPEELCSPQQKECLEAPQGISIAPDDPDLTQPRLDAITFFVYNQRSPKRNKQLTEQQIRGQQLFRDIGCQSCHTESLPTVDNVDIHPYSDFLLHDMGDDLADNRPEFLATTHEWRTAPLWNTHYKVKHKTNFLHDARATTLTEAILWHGGEASASQQAFIKLPKNKRNALIDFLQAL